MLGIYFSLSFLLMSLILLIKRKYWAYRLFIVFLIGQITLNIYVFLRLGIQQFKYFTFDPLGAILFTILTLLSLATFYHGYLYLERRQDSDKRISVYHAALVGLIVSMSGVYFSHHLGVMWIFIEATTLFVSVLIYHDRSAYSLEATWKYIFICSMGVALAFMGILTLKIAVPKETAGDLSFSFLKQIALGLDPSWLKIAFLLILTGFSAKMGLFPLHTVCIDAHTVAPYPISAFISTALMNVGFLGIFRVFGVIQRTPIVSWCNHVLILSGIISIFIATGYLLKTKHYKRLFAYSSLENMGLIAVSLAAGTGGMMAAILQIVFHSLTKASLFYQIGQVHSITHTYDMEETGDYFKSNPLGGFILMVGFLGIMAMPPSGMFVSELMILASLFASEHIWLSLTIMFLLTIIIFALGKNILRLLFTASRNESKSSEIKLNPFEPCSQLILLGLVVFLGFFPPYLFKELIRASVWN